MSRFETLMLKLGHDPVQSYVEIGQYQDMTRCRRCGYQRRASGATEDNTAPCLVADELVTRRRAA
jgi:hypothetical protein